MAVRALMSRNLIRPVVCHQAVSLFAAKVVDPMDPTVKLGDSDYFKHQQLVQSLGSSSAPSVRFYFLPLPTVHSRCCQTCLLFAIVLLARR